MAATDGPGTEELVVRPLVAADIDGACALDAEAGWNQVAADWQYMVAAGRGLAVEAPDHSLIATAMVLPGGNRFGWIAMILVTRDWQRRGIATMLIRRCLAVCDELGITAGLDATEQGRPVYLRLGFHDVYALSRFTTDRPERPAMPTGVRPLTDADLAEVAQYDCAVFGADRTAMLRHLLARRPDLAFVAERDGAPAGFVMGRDGRLATQVGPLVADGEEPARDLLAAALQHCSGPVLLDLVDRHPALRAFVAAVGFARQRGYVRMLNGRDRPFDDPGRNFIIAGPEFG